MSSTEATRTDEATTADEARTTDSRTTEDVQDRSASSAAERLGGPSESEQREDTTARRAETGTDHQADTPAEPQATLIPADRAES